MGPFVSGNFKTLLLQLLFFFNQTFSYNALVTVLTKVTYRNFEISNLISKKRLILTLWPMEK